MKKIGILVLICLTLCSACSKDTVLDIYKDVNERLGDIVLTNKSKLKGIREYGSDHYTGSYKVTYDNFSGKEVIFGGTTIERDENVIHIKMVIEESKGNLQVIMKLKEKEEVLANDDGTYEFTFDVKDGSNYLKIVTKDYSGKLNINVA